MPASGVPAVVKESLPTMNSDFDQSLKNILHRFDQRDTPRAAPAKPPRPRAAASTDTVEARHRKWFAGYAPEHVIPLLTHVVEEVKKRRLDAHCRLAKDGDMCVAELVLVPPGLPQGARAPQLTIAAAPGPRGLSLEYTGTFPHTGAEGGFGAEVQYDTIYTNELEEHILEFVGLATGA